MPEKEEQLKIESFDENGVVLLKELSDRNNEYGALRKQEEEIKVQMNNLRKVIHDVKTGRLKINTLYVPFGSGLRQLNLSDKDEFVKQLNDTYYKLDNQMKGVIGQRQHRGDAYGEVLLRTLKYFWRKIRYQYDFTDTELYQKILKDINPEIEPMHRDKKTLDQLYNKIQEEKKADHGLISN